MKWIVLAIAAMAAAFGSVWVAGSLLPEQHRAVFEGQIEAPIDVVFSRLVDFSAYPTWLSGTDTVVLTSDGPLPRYTISGDFGTMPIQVDLLQPPNRLITYIADDSLPFGGRWDYQLTSLGHATEVRITEDGSVSGPIARLIARFIIGHTRTMENFFNDLTAASAAKTNSP